MKSQIEFWLRVALVIAGAVGAFFTPWALGLLAGGIVWFIVAKPETPKANPQNDALKQLADQVQIIQARIGLIPRAPGSRQ